MFIYSSIYLFTPSHIYLSIYLFIYLSIYLLIHSLIYSFILPSYYLTKKTYINSAIFINGNSSKQFRLVPRSRFLLLLPDVCNTYRFLLRFIVLQSGSYLAKRKRSHLGLHSIMMVNFGMFKSTTLLSIFVKYMIVWNCTRFECKRRSLQRPEPLWVVIT